MTPIEAGCDQKCPGCDELVHEGESLVPVDGQLLCEGCADSHVEDDLSEWGVEDWWAT